MDNPGYVFVIQVPLSVDDNTELVYSLEDTIELAAFEDSIVDGHDIGSGKANIFIHTNQPTVLFEKLKPMIDKELRNRSYVIAFRSRSGEAYDVLWPVGLGEFRIQ